MNKILYLISGVTPEIEPITVNQDIIPRLKEEVYLLGKWYEVTSVRYIYHPIPTMTSPTAIHVTLKLSDYETR